MLVDTVSNSHLSQSLTAFRAASQVAADGSIPASADNPVQSATSDSSVSSPSAIYVRMEHYQSSTYNRVALTQADKVAEVEQPAAGAIKASSTILNFIEAQLVRDIEAGASLEELSSRLQAGLEGFEKGYGEALEILQHTEGMNDQIWEEIEQTQTLVREGIDALRQRFIEGGSEQSPVADRHDAAKTAIADSQRPAAVESHYGLTEVAEKNSFAFKLVTADGDTVVIKADSLRASIMETYVTQMESVQEQMHQSQVQKDRFSLQVKGELDAQELKAINDLLNQVGDLSEQFFAGNLDQAFAMATSLGYDSSEISAFALNLSHTAVRKVTDIYESVSPERQQLQSVERLQVLGDYINRFMRAYDTATVFSSPAELLQSLASRFDEAHNSRFTAAVSYMLAGRT